MKDEFIEMYNKLLERTERDHCHSLVSATPNKCQKTLEWAIQYAKKKECNILQLTSNKQRRNAIKFYENLFCVKPSPNLVGATQILHKLLEYEHGTHSKNPISRFGINIMLWPILFILFHWLVITNLLISNILLYFQKL
jgi:hypothetical protein